jgi:hypothetical protein
MGSILSYCHDIMAYSGFWWGNLRERDHLGHPDVDGRLILRWFFRKLDVGYGLDRCGWGLVNVIMTCECDNDL